MIGAPDRAAGGYRPIDRKHRLRDVHSGGWTAMLIGHNAQAVAAARKPQHGFQEIVAEQAEYPGGAQDDMPPRRARTLASPSAFVLP